MDKEKFLKLMGLAFDIQKMGNGVNGFPFVEVSSSNYLDGFTVWITEGGYTVGKRDGDYWFGIRAESSERTYADCMKHLEEMKQRAEGFVESRLRDEKEK